MKLFGTDGIRGKANILITPTLSFKVGAFLGQYGKQNKILIAYDTRRSGTVIASSIIAGILSSGGDVGSIGVAPTPALAYLCKKHNYDYGIMISASHNPFADNGIKIFDTNGFKIRDDIEREIESYIASNVELPLRTHDQIGIFTDQQALLKEYVHYVRAAYRDTLKLKLLVDGANGSASSVIQEVLEGLNLKADIICIKPDGININDNCGSTHIDKLRQMILDAPGKYDLGVAFDGDADRVLFIGPKGEDFDGDYVLYLLAKHYKKLNILPQDMVVVTVMANYGLNVALANIGAKHVATDVGDKYVQREMVEHGYLIGGEQSGHTIFNGYIKTGDGIYTLMKVLDVLAAEQTTFGSFVTEFKKFPQKLVNIKVVDKVRAMQDPTLLSEIKRCEKTLGGHGRILVRSSGTEQLVRVMVEALSEEEAEGIANHLAAFVK
ncbi:MAG: phosphoglucosamine mutase [Bacilli bacterium]